MEKQILSFNDLPSALSLVINKLEILEEKFSTLMTQIQPIRDWNGLVFPN